MTENSGPEVGHGMVTGFHEEVTYCSPSTSPGKQNRNCSTSWPQNRSENTPATIEAGQILLALQQLAQLCKLFLITSTEFPNCQSHLPQRCPRSMVNLKSLSCWKTFCKRDSYFIINWVKMTESTTSILSWGELRYKLLKTFMAQPDRIGRNPRSTWNPKRWQQQNTNSRNLSSIQQIES